MIEIPVIAKAPARHGSRSCSAGAARRAIGACASCGSEVMTRASRGASQPCRSSIGLNTLGTTIRLRSVEVTSPPTTAIAIGAPLAPARSA